MNIEAVIHGLILAGIVYLVLRVASLEARIADALERGEPGTIGREWISREELKRRYPPKDKMELSDDA